MISCAWFKLLLDSHVEITDFDDSELETLAKSEGDGMYRLPQGMTAEEVTAAYLTPFYRHVMGHLEKRFSADMLQSMQIEYYFTVPALWSDRAKAATRSAAMTAGFASRTGDTIFMIPEPEAAAVAALKSLAEGSSGQSQLKPNTAVMIVDCGGGTVDLSTYKITQVYPTLKFEELIPGIGGKCGSVWIERRFHTWMSQVFPGHWEKVSFEKKGPGSPFMKEFEIQKRDFGSSTDPNQEFEVALVMPDVEENRYYDASECMVKFYRYGLQKQEQDHWFPC